MDTKNTTAPECSKCKAPMQEGFILDRTYGANLLSTWVEGLPERSFWTGFKLRRKRRRPVRTFRCTACGFLESFAS